MFDFFGKVNAVVLPFSSMATGYIGLWDHCALRQTVKEGLDERPYPGKTVLLSHGGDREQRAQGHHMLVPYSMVKLMKGYIQSSDQNWIPMFHLSKSEQLPSVLS